MNEYRSFSVRRHDDGIDMWEMVSAPPETALVGLVDRYCAYAERTGSFSARRELAATSGVLIYVLGDPLSITGADGVEIVLQPGEAFVGGIADATSISRALGAQSGIHVHMPLESLAAVCGAPVAEIANRCVPLADMIGRRAHELGQALGEARERENQFLLLDDFLAGRLDDRPETHRPVRWAMEQLRGADAPTVESLANEIGWSRKHLGKRFAAIAGVTPRTFRRLARFERLCRSMARRPESALAMLAVEAGYFDQAHMTHEVVAFSAMTPGDLRARLIPTKAACAMTEVSILQSRRWKRR